MLGDLVVFYLFLGGAGAGLLLVTVILEILSPQAIDQVRVDRDRHYAPMPTYRRFFGPAYGTGIVAVILGMLCLLLDLGRMDRALSLFFDPSLSYISIGSYALVILVVLSIAPVVVWIFGVDSLRCSFMRVIRILIIIAALVVMTYTGLFLYSMSAVSLWDTVWLVPLFVTSAASCGIALLVCSIILSGSKSEFASTLRRLQRIDAIVIVCEIVLLVLFLITACSVDETAQMSVERLLTGDLAFPFLGLVVVCGLVVPFVCELLNRKAGARFALVASILVLVGGFFLRWCISEAGMAVDMVESIMKALGI